MANMSYCRFRNTALDLEDVARNLWTLKADDQSFNTTEERQSRRRIFELCGEILDQLGVEVDFHDIEGLIDENAERYEEEEEEDTTYYGFEVRP